MNETKSRDEFLAAQHSSKAEQFIFAYDSFDRYTRHRKEVVKWNYYRRKIILKVPVMFPFDFLSYTIILHFIRHPSIYQGRQIS